MPKIQVLKPHIANQIAAGEVVERPASVVKELVENSLDAGATSITVEISGGGMQSITVSDNGCGIPAEDCASAFLRHATSKIQNTEDLGRITTLGFRGEALASIASVAKVTMISRTEAQMTGTRIEIENGTMLSESETASAKGTTFRVESLFASVPARLKFLKTPRSEAGYIGDYLARMILSRPDVAFRYVSDGKTVYETYGDGDAFNAMFSIYGRGLTDYVLPVYLDNGYIKVEGYLGLPEISRANRTYQTLFVNRRYIRSAALSAAVSQAFGTRLMSGRFPFFVLNVTVAPGEVDVNVHPTKTEVRFAEERRVFSAVLSACSDALSDHSHHIETAVLTSPAAEDLAPDAAAYEGKEETRSNSVSQSTTLRLADNRIDRSELIFRDSASDASVRNPFRSGFSILNAPNGADAGVSRCGAAVQTSLISSKQVRVIGCAFLTYWIAECNNELFLIDQHAAHERKLYEQLQSETIAVAAQSLLLPKTVTLTPSEMDALACHCQELQDLGFMWEETNHNNSIRITACPVLNGVLLQESYLSDVLHLLMERGSDIKQELVKNRLMQSACKHAIKAGDRIDEAQVRDLILEFLDGTIPLTCPHGRPILIRLTRSELEKMFRRIV